MKRFTLTIDLENDAFQESPGIEVARILRRVADKVEDGGTTGQRKSQAQENIRDINGNKCGQFELRFDCWDGELNY